MSKKRLTIDVRMINDSGIGTYLKNILPGILPHFRIFLLGNKKELLGFSAFKNCEIIDFNAKIYSIREQLQYPFKIPTTDIFWSPHFNSPILPIKAVKRITTIHDVNHLTTISKLSFFKKLYSKILYRNAIKKSDEIITVSNFSKSEIVKYINADEKKITVIYCGVNKDFHQPKLLIKEMAMPQKYMLFVGNVKPHKNLKTVLIAYNNLTEELKTTYKLVILGKKSGFITPEKNIFKFIKENLLSEFVFFTGYIEDAYVPSIYKNAQFLVFPSLYEGFGLPIIEAMAVGIPVLSSNAASLPEIGGEAIIYFDPLNTVALKNKMEQLLLSENLQMEYINKGYKRVKDFTWEHSLEKHIALLKKD